MKKCTICFENKKVTEFYKWGGGKSGMRPSCKICHRNVKAISESTPEGFAKYLFAISKNNANQRDLSHNISVEDLRHLYLKHDGKCVLSGIKMTYDRHLECKGKSDKSFYNMSVDRIDNNKGYEKDNIQLVCLAANLIKLDWSTQEFFEICKNVSKYHS